MSNLTEEEKLRIIEEEQIRAEARQRFSPTPSTTSHVIVVKNPGVAAVLSFLIPGLGQIYNGQIGHGIGLMILWVIALFSIFAGIGVFLVPILWIVGIVDAYSQAVRINRDQYEDPTDTPTTWSTPERMAIAVIILLVIWIISMFLKF